MRELPPTLWQSLFEGEAESRFSVGAPPQPGDEPASDALVSGALVSSALASGALVSGAGSWQNSREHDALFAPKTESSEAFQALESLRADVTVALFNELTAAALARPLLAPILMDALDCALETLLLYTSPSQLCAVREWLMHK